MAFPLSILRTLLYVILAIDEYIYFYNYERYQKRLNGLSPKEYRAKAA